MDQSPLSIFSLGTGLRNGGTLVFIFGAARNRGVAGHNPRQEGTFVAY